MAHDLETEVIHQLLLQGELVQVDEIDPETGEYKIWTKKNANAAGLRVIQYVPGIYKPAS